MGIINVASGNSVWRGLDYYKENKVKSYKKINDFEYEGIVTGSNKEKYNVFMNVEHPRSSKCNCPHAKDKKIICKHIIALYFTVFPKEVESFFRISHKCASKWLQPTGWLYPAIKKNGRKIILDLDYALKLKAKRDQTANPEEGGQSHE